MLSEPEDRYMGEFIAAVQEQQPLLGAVDYHTCGSLLLWPWQYTTEQIPEPDYIEYELLGLAQEGEAEMIEHAPLGVSRTGHIIIWAKRSSSWFQGCYTA
eukprot:SAG31_NODE_194_length_20722_cov_19.854192_8_plen_100_part_00